MTEPRIEGSLGDLEFRSPSSRRIPKRGDGNGNFWTGVAIFVGVALVYPFYSYQVHSYLAAREISAAVADFSGQLDAMTDDARRQSEATARATAEQASPQRQQGVVVAGTTVIGGTRVVIVRLGRASLGESRATICRQAAARFGERLSGERLRVQRHRGAQPAVDAGTITCD